MPGMGGYMGVPPNGMPNPMGNPMSYYGQPQMDMMAWGMPGMQPPQMDPSMMGMGYMQQPQMMGQEFMMGGQIPPPGLYGQGLGMPQQNIPETFQDDKSLQS